WPQLNHEPPVPSVSAFYPEIPAKQWIVVGRPCKNAAQATAVIRIKGRKPSLATTLQVSSRVGGPTLVVPVHPSGSVCPPEHVRYQICDRSELSFSKLKRQLGRAPQRSNRNAFARLRDQRNLSRSPLAGTRRNNVENRYWLAFLHLRGDND